MKKTLIALAVAASIAPAAAFAADTTVYGKFHGSFAQVNDGEEGAMQIESHATRLGVKGKEDLGGGLAATYKAEFEFDLDGDSSGISKSRNTYVGLKGSFGEVRIGRHDDAEKMSMKGIDQWGDTYADFNNVILNDNRENNALTYLGKFGPVKVAATYSPSDSDAENGDGGTSPNEGINDDALTSIMGRFESKQFHVAVASTSADDETSTAVSGAFNADAFKVTAALQMIDDGAGTEATGTYLGAKLGLGDGLAAKAAFGVIDIDGVDETPTMTAIGVEKKMSKKTSVYALFANGTEGGIENKGVESFDGDASAISFGIVKKF